MRIRLTVDFDYDGWKPFEDVAAGDLTPMLLNIEGVKNVSIKVEEGI